MNSETEIPVTPTEATPASNIQSVDFSSEAKKLHRKIAKLPRPLRDLINSSLDDSLPAKEIIQKLQAPTDPPLPYPITEVDISRWKSTGYMRYLAQQDHLDSIEASREAALEMVRTSNNLSLPQATLQVIASQCFEILADFSPAAVKQKLAEDPLKYTSFLHVFARLTREIVHLEKFQDARLAAEAKKLDPDRDLSESETLVWGGRLDRAFHRKDPRRIKTHKPAPDETETPRARALWTAPAERSGDGALANTSAATDLKTSSPDPLTPTPTRTSSFPEVGRGVPTAPLQVPVEPVTSICPSSPSSPSSPLPSRPCQDDTPAPARVTRPKKNRKPKTENPSLSTPDPQPASPVPPTNQQIHQSINPVSEHCLDCHHPLPPLTPEGKRPFERCQICNVTLPPPGTCTRPSADKCHFCGVTLPRRLPNGRRPRPTCHNCGSHLGRELDEDTKKYADE